MAEAQLNESQDFVPEMVDEVIIEITEQDVATKVDENDDKDKGRYDDFGNFIKNLEYLPDLYSSLMKFQEVKKASPNAIVLILSKIEKPTRLQAYQALTEMKVDASKVKGMFHKGNKGFNIEFYEESWKRHVLLMVNKYYHQKYHAYSCVRDTFQVTVGQVPVHIEDFELLEFLNIFGEFEKDLSKVIHRFDDNGAHTGERVFYATKMNVDIPSFWSVFGNQLSFRYPGQPHTCKLCGKRGHRGYECNNGNMNATVAEPQVNGEHTMESNAPRSSAYQEDASRRTSMRSNKYSRTSQPYGSGSNRYPAGGNKNYLSKSWADGGYRPDNFRPEYLQNGGHRKPRRPTSANLGDYFKAKIPDEITVNTATRKKIVLVAKKAAEIENESLINSVESKLEDMKAVIGDNIFTNDSREKAAKSVQQILMDVKKMCGGPECEFNVDGSPENIRRLIDYDVELLEGCAQRIGAPCGGRLRAPAFQTIIENFVSGLKTRKRSKSSGNSDDEYE